jgi:hypothetical protein
VCTNSCQSRCTAGQPPKRKRKRKKKKEEDERICSVVWQVLSSPSYDN